MTDSQTRSKQTGASPKHKFILNPYLDQRFTRCPRCEGLMRLRKIPLLIHVKPRHLLALRMTCKLCPGCDILVVHQDELEQQLAVAYQDPAPEVIGNDYLVLGTVDVDVWREGLEMPRDPAEMQRLYHPFRDRLGVKFSGGWVRTDQP